MNNLNSSAAPSGCMRGSFTMLLALSVLTFVSILPLQSSAQQNASVESKKDNLQFVVFGDSLQDVGTYAPVAKKLFDGGRFTTNPGEVFIEHVARSFGDKLKPAYVGGLGLPLRSAGGLDYAEGGSRVTLQPGLGHAPTGTPNADFAELTTLPVAKQIKLYLTDHRTFTSDQVVFLNGGADDVFINLAAAQAAGTPAAEQAAETAIAQAAKDLASLACEAIDHGAQHVVLVNLPDLGVTPEGAANAATGSLLTLASSFFNETLTTALQQDSIANQVLVVDAFTLLDQDVSNFEQYGFSVSNTATACDLQAQVAKATALGLPDPTAFASSLFCSPATLTTADAHHTFMFADTVHPTTHLGKVLAKQVEEQLQRDGLSAQYKQP